MKYGPNTVANVLVLGCRAERERQLREKVRQHAEQVRERRARPADNPVDDMRAAQRELEIVSTVAAVCQVDPHRRDRTLRRAFKNSFIRSGV